MVIFVSELIGRNHCISSEDGDKVFEALKRHMVTSTKVYVSFKDIHLITSAFLNNAIGRLLKNNSKNTIKHKLFFKDISSFDKELIEQVIENADRYYKNPRQFEARYKSAIKNG